MDDVDADDEPFVVGWVSPLDVDVGSGTAKVGTKPLWKLVNLYRFPGQAGHRVHRVTHLLDSV